MKKGAIDIEQALERTKKRIDDLVERKRAKKLTQEELEERAIEIGTRLVTQIHVLSLTRAGLANADIARRMTRDMEMATSPDSVSRWRYAKQTASPEHREALESLRLSVKKKGES